MTFSLVARCKEKGLLGIAISSSSPAVAARCPYARAGVGAVSTQNVTDPTLGPLVLNLMEEGATAPEAIVKVQKTVAHMEYRQILAVDKTGQTALHSGGHSLGVWAEASGDNVISAGNLLDNADVPHAIIEGFLSTPGHLGDRLLAGLKAGLAGGGEAGSVHSAGLLLVDELAWPIVDLRCDWLEDDCPIANVADAWQIYKPQINAYIERALNPACAPSYNVPGDE